MIIHRKHLDQRGLTLLELLVVLTILVVLSTVAITSTSGLADQARYEATQRTLENIRDAVLGPANLRDTDGTLIYTGFVADTGRLPQVVDDGTHSFLTLAELVQQPAGMAAYQVLPAITSHCTPSDEADAADPVSPALASSDTVQLGVGWRGPYLRLPPGNLLPRDGWGTELVSYIVDPGGYPSCLLKSIGSPATAAGDPIDQIVSYGRDLSTSGTEAYDGDLYIPDISKGFSDLVAASVSVQVEIQDSTGNVLNSSSDITKVFVRLFEPNSSDGTISVVAAAGSENASDPYNSYAVHDRPVLTFSPVSTTPGIRAARAYALTTNDSTRPLNVSSLKSAPAYLKVRPGNNTVKLVIIYP